MNNKQTVFLEASKSTQATIDALNINVEQWEKELVRAVDSAMKLAITAGSFQANINLHKVDNGRLYFAIGEHKTKLWKVAYELVTFLLGLGYSCEIDKFGRPPLFSVNWKNE